MRTIDQTLTLALAAGTGKPYLKGYIGYTDGSVLHSDFVTRYKLTGSTLEFEMPYIADAGGDQDSMWLERGVIIAGVNYTVTTGRFRILSQHYLPNRHQVATGALFPRAYYSADGNGTYQNVITAFLAAYGKTAVFRDPAAAWLGYQFFPAGKSIILNDANSFANLLAQKYLIFLCDNGSEQVLVYSCADAFPVDPDYTLSPVNDFHTERSTRSRRLLMWRDENEAIHTSGLAGDPIHNLGYLPSTAAAPARTSAPRLFQTVLRPDLRVLDGDVVRVTTFGVGHTGYALMTEEYAAPTQRHAQPRWQMTITANEVFGNTAGGAMPSTIERVSNYTPLNTSMFNGLLSSANNNLQSAMDRIDDHISYSLAAAAASFSPADGGSYYFGSAPSEPPQTAVLRTRIFAPVAGRITGINVFWVEWGGVAGSAETITANVLLNGVTRTLINTQASTAAAKLFSNKALSIAVTNADAIEIEIVCPTWVTNPTLVRLSATIVIQT